MATIETVAISEPNQSSEPEGPNRILFAEFLPHATLSNATIEEWGIPRKGNHILTAELIQRSTGVKIRRTANELETPLYMAELAAVHLFTRIKDLPIGLIIVSTTYPTGDNLSETLTRDLRISGDTTDVYAACSGSAKFFVHLKENEEKYWGQGILAIASEKHTHIVWDMREKEAAIKDPSRSQLLMSDAAEAMYFVYGKGLVVLAATTENLGNPELITGPYVRLLLKGNYIEEPPGIGVTPSFRMQQDGDKVSEVVLATVPDLIAKTVEKAGLTPADITLVIPHQPSMPLLKDLRESLRELGFAPEKFIIDIEEGNTSSASILKALHKAILEKRIKKGDKVVLAGFGAGMTASAAVIQI